MQDLQMEWMAAMRRSDYTTAWSINDAVLAGRNPATRDDPGVPYHRRWVWDGRAFQGRHVLVRCYHGLGDTLQYARFLPVLRRRVASLTVEVQPELLPLLAGMPGPDRWVPFILDAPCTPSDCDIEVMELAHALRMAPDGVPTPYLAVAPSDVPPHTIGLCWQAGPWDSDRSMPGGLMASLIASHSAVSLVPDVTDLPVLNPGGMGDIAATAALIAGVDLVITIDTMVAHLAGALGRPTKLLLKHHADWRWGLGDVNAWYPSIQQYRQTTPGDWHGVVARVRGDLMAIG